MFTDVFGDETETTDEEVFTKSSPINFCLML